MADLLEALKRKRAGFEAECVWIRFLHDAHRGTGGFEGKVRQPPAGYWGAGAEMYAQTDSLVAMTRDTVGRDTYLDRHSREDDPKFQSRVDVSHYPNYVGPLTNLKVSYILRKEFTRSDVPEAVEQWREDIDGKGTTFEEARSELVPLAAECGWVPVVVDMDPIPEGTTRAQAEEAGLGRPRLVPLHPTQLLEWAWSDGRFLWAKVRTDHTRQIQWQADPQTVHRYTVWTEKDATVYETVEVDGEEQSPTLIGTFQHAFGRVPLTILRHSKAADGVRGEAMHGSVATEARRLFNLVSELDEHIRAQAFAILVIVGGSVQQGELKLGTDNALPLSPDSKNQHYFMAPPAQVSAMLETRIENTIREIYRIAGVEFSRPQAAAVSGVARRYEFSQTDSLLAKFAKSISQWELDVDDLVGAALGVDASQRKAERIKPPTSFDLEDLAAELKIVLDAISVKLGETATRLMRLRVVQSVLQQISPADRSKIEAELLELATREAEQAKAPPPPPPSPAPVPGEDDDEGEEDPPAPDQTKRAA